MLRSETTLTSVPTGCRDFLLVWHRLAPTRGNETGVNFGRLWRVAGTEVGITLGACEPVFSWTWSP